MATITKTPSKTWKAVIRKRGWPATIKTFHTKRDAEDWARRTEDEMVRGVYINRAGSDRLLLKASWTKGGRERNLPIRTEVQRQVLNRAHRLAGCGSLIPSNRNYVHQMRVYEGNTRRAGLRHMHGPRHAYAQDRYEELTGWSCPAAGGSVAKDLTAEQRDLDHEARLTISRELGHEREAVVGAYIGK